MLATLTWTEPKSLAARMRLVHELKREREKGMLVRKKEESGGTRSGLRGTVTHPCSKGNTANSLTTCGGCIGLRSVRRRSAF